MTILVFFNFIVPYLQRVQDLEKILQIEDEAKSSHIQVTQSLGLVFLVNSQVIMSKTQDFIESFLHSSFLQLPTQKVFIGYLSYGAELTNIPEPQELTVQHADNFTSIDDSSFSLPMTDR